MSMCVAQFFLRNFLNVLLYGKSFIFALQHGRMVLESF